MSLRPVRSMRPFALFAALLLSACVGPEGATGPAGPQGPQGVTGPTGPQGKPGSTPHLFSAIVTANGTVIRELTLPDSYVVPPVMSCYLSTNIPHVWVQVSDGYSETGPYCIVFYSPSDNTWNAMMLQAPPGATAIFVVVF